MGLVGGPGAAERRPRTRAPNGATTSAASTSCGASIRCTAFSSPSSTLLARLNRRLFRDSLPEIHRADPGGRAAAILAGGRVPGRSWSCWPCSACRFYVYLFFADVRRAAGLVLAAGGRAGHGLAAPPPLGRAGPPRLRAIKRRMPFLLDLLTLLMEAGSTFLNALRQAVEEFRGHPVAEEFGRVLADMNLGKTRMEAFQAMRDRLADDEITSIIGSILQGETPGDPAGPHLPHPGRRAANQAHAAGRSIAGEAGVNMLLPGVLIMAATVLIILGPFLLNYLTFGLSM